MINPTASIANKEVYGIPMLFVIGGRGESGKKDEPQHAYQGKITYELLEIYEDSYIISTTGKISRELYEQSNLLKIICIL